MAIGNALGAISHGVLSAWGPRHGLAQMVLSRTAFGYRGNILPATLMSLMAGVGWFAVNSISGAYALATLLGLSPQLSLAVVIAVQVLVAFFGHNLIHLFERVALPFLAVAFVLAAVGTFGHAAPRTPRARAGSRRHGRLPHHPRGRLRLRGRVEPVRLGLHALPARG